MMAELIFQKLSKTATGPSRATPGSAGMDLFSIDDFMIPSEVIYRVKTGLALIIPDGHYGHICDKSGGVVTKLCVVLAGILDCDYRRTIDVCARSPCIDEGREPHGYNTRSQCIKSDKKNNN